MKKFNSILLLLSCCFHSIIGLDRLFSNTHCSSVCQERVFDGYDGYTQDLINGIYTRANVNKIDNPAAPFTFVATTDARNANGDTVYLPLIVQATVRAIGPVTPFPADITSAARTNVNRMYNGLSNGIDVGYLIAVQNGGTRDLFNYVGQTEALNRGPWKTLENEINSWINYGGTVEMKIVVVYNGTIPKEFVVKMKFFNGDGTLHSDLLDMVFKNI